MPLARSRVTSQGQISIPSDIRKRLGIGPGSILEWDEADGEVILRRSGGSSFEDIHRVLFPEGTPPVKSLSALKDGIRQYMLKRYERD